MQLPRRGGVVQRADHHLAQFGQSGFEVAEVHHHRGHHPLPESVVVDSEHRALGDSGVRRQRGLDRAGQDGQAAGADRVVGATQHAEAPGVADGADELAQPKTVIKAQLAIKGPKTAVCPNEATISGWVFTNYAGPVQVMIARKAQGVGQPMMIDAKPAANGQFMASFTRTLPIVAAINVEYRLMVGGGGGVVSNWVPLKASCKIGGGPDNLLGG